ncbi:MAG: hypothetical protein LAT61_04655 [Alcanivorax sp.]|nr:hypothetical protein [Alcanivorax sp.]
MRITTEIVSVRRFAIAASLLLSGLVLSGCNGGEDFSDVRLPGCAFGALCRENIVGEVFVEVVGPKPENLRYRCGNSISQLRSEPFEVESSGRIIPPYTAVCPNNAQQIDFFIGSRFFEGTDLPFGKVLIPSTRTQTGARAAAVPVREQGRMTLRVTLADMIDSPRRVKSQDNNQVRNRWALLRALGSPVDDVMDPVATDGPISIPLLVHQLVDNRFEELLSIADLDEPNYNTFTAGFQPLLDALNAELDQEPGEEVFYAFPADPGSDIVEVSRAMDQTRAGNLSLGYNNTELGAAEYLFSGKKPNLERLGLFTSDLLVLPTGDLLGLGTVLVADSVTPPGETNPTTTTRRGLVAVRGTLDDELVFTNVAFENLMADMDTTEMEFDGRLLADYVFSGVAGRANEADETEAQPDFALFLSPDLNGYKPVDADFGRLDGRIKGYDTDTLLEEDTIDPPGLPVRGGRVSRGSASVSDEVLDDLVGLYTLTIMRGCTKEDPGEGEAVTSECFEEISEEEQTDYPVRFEIVNPDGGPDEIDVTFNFDFARKRPGSFSVLGGEQGALDTCVEIERDPNGNGIIYVGVDGACPDFDVPDMSFPIGFVGNVINDEDGDPLGAVVFMLFTGDEDKIAQYGVRIEGAIALQECGLPLVKPSNEGLEEVQRARWVDNYRPVLIQAELPDEHDFENLDGTDAEGIANRQLVSNLQGLVTFQRDGVACP